MNDRNVKIGLRIKARREQLGLTQEELGNKLFLNKSTIARYEAGKISTIKKPFLHAAAKQLNVNPDWLNLDTDEMGTFSWKDEWYKDYKEPLFEQYDNIKPNAEILSAGENIYKIPVFSSVSAGFGAYAYSDVIDYMHLFIANPADVPEMLCIKVTGDSMYPKIEDGDIIVVRKQESVDSGSIAVVLVDGEEGFVKKVIYDKEIIELHSINPEYAPKIFKGAEVLRVRVVGIVKQVIKTL